MEKSEAVSEGAALRRPAMHVARQRHLLDDYVGFDIEVHYNVSAAYSDRGVLQRHGDGWIELARNVGKPKQDTILVPVESIRMIRPVGPPMTPESMLLRPAEPNAQEDEA